MSETLNDPVVLGAGPVARSVVAALLERGCAPTVVTRDATEIIGSRSISEDVSGADGARRAVTGASVVFQCAQPPYHRWTDEFPAMQRSILDACATAGTPLVAAENVYGYGKVTGPMSADTDMKPCSSKGAVRATMWQALLDAHTNGTVPTAAVRASDFFGPGVVGSVYGSRFFDAIANGRRAEVLGDPDALHSITYVSDFGRALVAVAAEPNAWGRAWHAPTAPAVTQRSIVEIAATAINEPPRLRTVPPWQLRLVGLFTPMVRESIEMLYQFESDFVVDSTEFEQHFGIHPIPLDESIAETVEASRRDGER